MTQGIRSPDHLVEGLEILWGNDLVLHEAALEAETGLPAIPRRGVVVSRAELYGRAWVRLPAVARSLHDGLSQLQQHFVIAVPGDQRQAKRHPVQFRKRQ